MSESTVARVLKKLWQTHCLPDKTAKRRVKDEFSNKDVVWTRHKVSSRKQDCLFLLNEVSQLDTGMQGGGHKKHHGNDIAGHTVLKCLVELWGLVAVCDLETIMSWMKRNQSSWHIHKQQNKSQYYESIFCPKHKKGKTIGITGRRRPIALGHWDPTFSPDRL